MAGEDQSLRQWIVQNKLKAICERTAAFGALRRGLADDCRRAEMSPSRKRPRPAVGFWAGGLGLSLAYQWTRPIPTQVKEREQGGC